MHPGPGRKAGTSEGEQASRCLWYAQKAPTWLLKTFSAQVVAAVGSTLEQDVRIFSSRRPTYLSSSAHGRK